MLRINPVPDELSDIVDRYVEFHRGRGNDPHVGLRLGEFVRRAGLDEVEFRGRFEIAPFPAGMRPAAVAASDQMLSEGIIGADDVRRWKEAFALLDGNTDRPTLFNPTFIAVGRRPA
jgi:hypothetical protein